MYDDNGMCIDACPDDGMYSVDDDFVCCKLYPHFYSHCSPSLPSPPPPLPITLSPHIAVRLCPNSLGTVVENGDVTYTPGLRDGVGYVEDTTASVECRSGYEREGENAVCGEDGTWSSALANCSEGNVKTP